MKIDRVLGIVTILLKEQRVTATYLAEYFEVSTRTILRDLDDLLVAGIPIITTQGYDGGVSIDSSYNIDKTLFTIQEIQSIFQGLKGIDSISRSSHEQTLKNKLALQDSNLFSQYDYMYINLSSYYKESLMPKIELLKEAITQNFIISFDYYKQDHKQQRIVEPYFIVFEWSSWYLLAYCCEKQDFRLFKLNRMWNLEQSSDSFLTREIAKEALAYHSFYQDEIKVVAHFEEEAKHRLIDEYGMDCYVRNDENKLYFERFFHNEEYAFSWLMSYGSSVEVMKPEQLRNKIMEETKKILHRYKEHDI